MPRCPTIRSRISSPITLVAASPNVLSVNPSVPAKTVQELIALMKANPGKYSYAQPGIGSTPHLAGELFKLKFGLDLAIVPFTGAAPAITFDHRRPHADRVHGAAAGDRQHQGRQAARARGARPPSASPALPDVPTMAEAGIPDQEADTMTGIVAPAGTPKEIVERWHARDRAHRRAAGHQASGCARSASSRSPIRRRSSPSGSRRNREVGQGDQRRQDQD